MTEPSLERGLSWEVGHIRVTSIVEMDHWWKLDRFLPDATRETVVSRPWIDHFVAEDTERFPLRIQAFVIEAGERRILVDACVGNDKPRSFRGFDRLDTTFLDDMVAVGHPPEAIDTVLCTHMHVDHVGWNTHLVDGSWVPTFPNARYLFGRVEFEHWVDETDEMTVELFADSVRPVLDAGLADLVEFEHEVCPGVTLVPTTGHTPGHVSVLIESEGQSAVITGDMTHHPVQIAFPDICSTADVDGEAASATRRQSFASWCDGDVLVIGTHYAPPTAARLVPDGDTWRLDI